MKNKSMLFMIIVGIVGIGLAIVLIERNKDDKPINQLRTEVESVIDNPWDTDVPAAKDK